jgi:hypothetical protein
LTSDSRPASALGFSTVDGCSAVPLDGIGRSGGKFCCLARMAMAAAAAAPAASRAVPAITFGQRRDRGLGGSSRRAVAASMVESRGATVSWTETLPRAALTAIHARALPTRGLAHVAALPAPRLAVFAALFVIGRAWSASLDACMAIFRARHCMSAAGMTTFFLDVTDTLSSPVSDPHRKLPRPSPVNRPMPRS